MKLHPALHTYWDPATKSDYIIGHTGDPIPVANAEELHKILDELHEQKSEATKVCDIFYHDCWWTIFFAVVAAMGNSNPFSKGSTYYYCC